MRGVTSNPKTPLWFWDCCKNCEWCGQFFLSHNQAGAREKRFCSRECKVKSWRYVNRSHWLYLIRKQNFRRKEHIREFGRRYNDRWKLAASILSNLGVNGVDRATAIATVKQLGINIGDYDVT